jgi:hypothetical protein
VTLVSYTYNDLGQQIAKTFPTIASANQTYAYNIRGWLKTLGSAHTEVFKQTLYYESGATNNRWNGNISRIDWSGMTGAGKTRTYNYTYDNPNRLTAATYTASGEANWFTVNGMTYDANGNIQTLRRRGQLTSPAGYGEIDSLTYWYESNLAFDEYSNKLIGVNDLHSSNSHTSKDFKPNIGSTQTYAYDGNGNLTRNKDKKISSISYNHLNLPDTVTFTGTLGKIVFGYNAEEDGALRISPFGLI